MNVTDSLNSAIKNIPKAVAAGVVDMQSGMMLGIKTTESHPQEVFDFLAAATKDMFEGDNVSTIENIFKKARGVKTAERYFQEIIVTSNNLLHFFSRIPGNQNIVFVAVCNKDANIGLVLVKGREITKDLKV
uniref:hypothetical protein n=1 Tax=Fulvivirga sp. TaxID=1931237 RepID=UPI004049F52B